MSNNRTIADVAADIRKLWGTKINYAARPYLNAMGSLHTGTDIYGMESGKTIVAYFLSNASSFRGPEAKALKSELKALAGIK